MKLLVIIVQDADAGRLRDSFSRNSVPFTKLASTGDFLRRGLCTFVSGVADDRVDPVKRIIEQNTKKRPAPPPTPAGADMAGVTNTFLDQSASRVEVGSATVFSLDVKEFIKL